MLYDTRSSSRAQLKLTHFRLCTTVTPGLRRLQRAGWRGPGTITGCPHTYTTPRVVQQGGSYGTSTIEPIYLLCFALLENCTKNNDLQNRDWHTFAITINGTSG